MPRYDWNAVQEYHDYYRTRNECMRHFGLCAATWTKAKKRGALRDPHSCRPEQIVAFRHRLQVRRVLMKSGAPTNSCYNCGIAKCVANDHRIENLRMLCPNCHSQTETFAGRNARQKDG